MKYIIFYAALKDNDYIPSYRIAYSKKGISSAINYAKKSLFSL